MRSHPPGRRFMPPAALILCALTLFLAASPAGAHNSLDGSDPADGAALSRPPAAVTFQFAAATPLDTVQVDLIDATGARQQLTGLRHGDSDQQVVAEV